MIQLTNVTAGYPGKTVIQNITLEFLPGEVLVLLGPNGSGKSTLLKAALGLLPTSDGTITYDGTPIQKLTRKQIAQHAAFLTQSRNTPSIQALKMVLHGRFPYLSYPRHYGKEDYVIARAALEATQCRQYEHTNVSQLSGGQRQGVYVAMSLAQDTQTIFMDEPTTYLDIRHQIHLMQTARSLALSGKAVVLVLHDIPLAMREADRIALLAEGKLTACGTPQQIFDSNVLKNVFGIHVYRTQTPHGEQYYCMPEEG